MVWVRVYRTEDGGPETLMTTDILNPENSNFNRTYTTSSAINTLYYRVEFGSS